MLVRKASFGRPNPFVVLAAWCAESFFVETVDLGLDDLLWMEKLFFDGGDMVSLLLVDLSDGLFRTVGDFDDDEDEDAKTGASNSESSSLSSESSSISSIALASFSFEALVVVP